MVVGVVIAGAALAAACLGEDADLSPKDPSGSDGGGNTSGDAGREVPPDPTGPGPDGGDADGGDAGEGGTPDDRNDFPMPIVDPGTPATAAQVFAQADVAGESGPCLFEPQVGSLIPKNWPRLRFRQKALQSENLFEIRLVVPNQKSPLVIYTNKTSYTLDQATWTTLKTHGVGSIDIRVRSAVVDGQGNRTGGPWKGSEGKIEIAPVEARGTISYFSTADVAIKRFRVGDETVQAGPTPANAGSTCVGCHAPTPDGAHAALTIDGTAGGLVMRPLAGGTSEPAFLTVSALTMLSRTNQFAPAFSKAHWSAGDRVLVSMFKVNTTSEIIWTDLEAATNAPGGGWGVFARSGDANSAVSATVSHDGTKIAYVSTTDPVTGTRSTNGRIAVIPYNARQGGPSVFVTGAAASNAVQYYPAFSPDDTMLAFDKVTSGSSYNNAAAELFVVPSAGGTAHRLAANDPPACLSLPAGVTTSWPRWSPEMQTQGTRKFYFIAFSSTRFGNRRQVFVAPVVVDGQDVKSYPALYPWNQPEAVENHTPSWSEPF